MNKYSLTEIRVSLYYIMGIMFKVNNVMHHKKYLSVLRDDLGVQMTDALLADVQISCWLRLCPHVLKLCFLRTCSNH